MENLERGPRSSVRKGRVARSIAGVGAGALVASLVGITVPAAAADLEEGSFSGAARNYGVFAGVGLVNDLANVRANIAESVTVADSEGLGDYAGTAPGDYAVPSAVANDETARAYSRSAPIAAGAIGIPIDIVSAESTSTTVEPSDEATQDFGNLEIPIVGTLEALTGATSTTWTDEVLTAGGTVADAVTTTGDLELITGLPGSGVIPGIGEIFPVGAANLGQSTNEVRLVADSDSECSGLAVETEATWQFADIQLFGGNVAVSWGGVGGINDERATIVARANGQPNGADVTVSELPAMTIAIGDAELDIEPGLGIELDEL